MCFVEVLSGELRWDMLGKGRLWQVSLGKVSLGTVCPGYVR